MIRIRAFLSALVLLVGLGFVGYSAHAGDKGFKPLFNGKNLEGWKFRLTKPDANPLKTFVVKDGIIHVSGFPAGYLYTGKSYKNYVLRYTWRYPKDQPKNTTMNSGCLMHIQLPHEKGTWPHSVEPQCRYKDHGKLFFIGFGPDAKKVQNFDEAAQKKALKPSYEWNTTEVISKNGNVEVRINGVLVNTGSSYLKSGPIGFQSEAARIDFKDIKIKVLD